MLYKKLHLINYKAFDDITFSLVSKNNQSKNLAIIYGANGSGKSTILEAFATLHDLMNTKDISNTLDLIREKMSNTHNIESDDISELTRYLSRGVTSISTICEKVQGTDSKKPTSIILDFEENGYNGSYEIRLHKKHIIYEELKYVITKNKGCYFKLDKYGIFINEKTILDKKTYKTLKALIKQSWGIHSFISIIKNEINNYNKDFIDNSILSNFTNLLNSLDKFNFRICNLSNTIHGFSKTNSYLLSHLSSGKLDRTSTEELEVTETSLSILLKRFINDLVKVEYAVTEESYHLQLIKLINNKEVDIDYSLESSGIKEIINILPYIIKAINGENVILDEYANHIHDVLSIHLLQTIAPLIKGQIIISTHSTILLNNLFEQYLESFYFIKVEDSKRKINCITDTEPRLRKEYNYQKKYLFDNLYINYRNTFDTAPIADTDIKKDIKTIIQNLS